jgi:hypothetical protein
MPLGFLVPAFLAGLAALAIPLLLHLRQRDRAQPFRFPSLMFLRRIPIETAHRRRVTDLPLLLLRALAVLLAVLAFSRPVVQRVGAAIAATPERVVIVALDRSMSMGHAAVWPAALDSARAVIAGLAAGDRVGVIAFDDEAVIMQPITTDHAAARATLGTIRPGARGTRFAAALRAARQQLLAGNLATAEVVIISDLQRSGIGGIPDLALPSGIAVRGVSVAAPSSANRAIAGLAVARLGGGAAGRIAVTAEVRGRALGGAQAARATLVVNNREAGARDLMIPADGMITAAFDPVALPPGEARVTVTLTPDDLAADDSFHAVVPAEASQSVLLVTPGDLPADATLFLERALAIGTDPTFRIERRSAASLDAGSLARAAALLLVDVAPPETPAVRAWLEAGHGAVVVMGPRLAAVRSGSVVMPARGDGEIDRLADRGGTLGDVALEHPVFAPFRAGGSAALSSARFIRYTRLVADTGTQILARFDDGAPALLERRIGAGRLLVSAIPLDARGGDFPLQPVYLPFVRRLALHAAGYQPQPLWRTAGEGWRPAARVRDLVIATPSAGLVRPDSGGTEGAATLDELGFYQAYQERAAGEPVAAIAVNPPIRESDLTTSPASELLVGVAPDLEVPTATERLTADEAEQRQRLWRILLMLVLAVLVGESVLGSSGWRGRAMRGVSDLPPGGAL